jgi:hypothetical protein
MKKEKNNVKKIKKRKKRIFTQWKNSLKRKQNIHQDKKYIKEIKNENIKTNKNKNN